jgi:hypothetical protein
MGAQEKPKPRRVEMPEYTLEMRDDQCGETKQIEAENLKAAIERAKLETTEWVEGGDWGYDGASIDARWTLTDQSGEELASDSITVEIAPDEESLMKDAGADDDCDHEFISTVEVEGGLKKNPGVWSTGGTSMVLKSHCKFCGLMRTERHTGSQRNPEEHDTVEFEMPNDEQLEKMELLVEEDE